MMTARRLYNTPDFLNRPVIAIIDHLNVEGAMSKNVPANIDMSRKVMATLQRLGMVDKQRSTLVTNLEEELASHTLGSWIKYGFTHYSDMRPEIVGEGTETERKKDKTDLKLLDLLYQNISDTDPSTRLVLVTNDSDFSLALEHAKSRHPSTFLIYTESENVWVKKALKSALPAEHNINLFDPVQFASIATFYRGFQAGELSLDDLQARHLVCKDIIFVIKTITENIINQPVQFIKEFALGQLETRWNFATLKGKKTVLAQLTEIGVFILQDNIYTLNPNLNL